MENLRCSGSLGVLLCIAISILWGIAVSRTGAAWIDFRAVYAGTRCLIYHHNPYNVSDLEREYESEDGARPQPTPAHLQSITLYVNMPTTFVVVAPLAAFSWWPAQVLWMLLSGCLLALALLLMWSVGARYSSKVSTLLACVLAINCESIFVGGNTAGIVVGLCGIAVWCFLENRFVRMGVVFLALSLALKPHDAGLVWLYFVLAGGAHRKRALQSLLITAIIGVTAALWVSHVAPTWMQDWNRNLATISAPGGINDPGPNAVRDGSMYSIVDLQAAISIFRDNARFYNVAAYLFCGVLLFVWSIWAVRARFSIARDWIALAAVVPFTLLITYHRLWDAKLLMLAIPGCCLLWAEGGAVGKAGTFFTSLAILMNGEISLATYFMAFRSLHVSANGILGRLLTVLQIRPASVALLVMGVFYLWLCVRSAHRSQTAVQQAVRELEHVSS